MNKKEIIKRYRNLDAARVFSGVRATLIHNALKEYNTDTGYEKIYMKNVINQTKGKKMVGFAKTLRMLPPRFDLITNLPKHEQSPEFKVMSDCTEQDVLVIDAMRLKHASVGGDVKFLNLDINNAEGVVTDGAIRDLSEVKKYGFKIFSASRTAAVGIPDVYPYEYNKPIACGEVLVQPDDLIIGDDEGVVVVPNFIILDVLSWAEEHTKHEKIIKSKAIDEKVSSGKFYNKEFFNKLNKGK